MAGSLLFSGNSHPTLAADIANYAGVPLGSLLFHPFPDHELSVEIQENVRGKVVFVVQSIAHRPNDYLMELFIILDALKRAAAKEIVVVMPYFGYARQDKRNTHQGPITAKLIADLLTASGATHLITMDLHADQIQGFFDIPVDNLCGRSKLVSALLQEKLDNPIIVAPDLGANKQARAFAKQIGAEFAVMDKLRHSPGEVEIAAIIGDVKGRDVLIIDDLIATGQTVIQAAKAAKKSGAKKIIAAVTHGLFIEDAQAHIQKSPIEKLLITDTIFQADKVAQIVGSASVFGDTIKSMLAT